MISRQEIQRHYTSLVIQYFEKSEEAALCSVADLGAELVATELPPEELAELHERALHALTQLHPALTPLETVKRVTAPLMELLMAYGVASRARRAEREHLDVELERARRLESLGRLAGGVAHDFNNLLTAILGNAEALLLDAALPEPFRGYLQDIDKAGQSAAALTRQLLTFARRDRRETGPLDLNAVLGDLRRLLERLPGQQIELVMQLDEPLFAMRADPSQIEQVMLNLVANARDAMPEGGRVLIETAKVERNSPEGCPALCPGHCAAGRCVLLTVSDSGSGMDAETRAQIFDPFFTTKEPERGTGLGLSVVHEVVAQAGGHVHVESAPGEGTRFQLLFPAEAAPAPAADRAEQAPRSPRGSETILLAEDDPAVRKLACRMLEDAGYTVIAAADGEQALRAARAHPGSFELLVTDVVMPQLGGPELAERLTSRDPRLPVLYVTGTPGKPGASKLEGRVLPKPFSRRDLLLQVRQTLDAR